MIPRRSLLAIAGLIVISILVGAALLRGEPQNARNNFGVRSPLPLPSRFLPERLPEFQKILSEFLQRGDYLRLGWSEDKGLRDTGPFIRNFSFGVHPTVKIYYSPEIMNWLVADRAGTIPDGAMIIKEQYTAPAAQYQLRTPDPVTDWTIMIKDAKGSKDGWYWAEIWKDQTIDSNNPPYSVPNAGFGLYVFVVTHPRKRISPLFRSRTSRVSRANLFLTSSIFPGRRHHRRQLPRHSRQLAWANPRPPRRQPHRRFIWGAGL